MSNLSAWHRAAQDLFPETWREVEFFIPESNTIDDPGRDSAEPPPAKRQKKVRRADVAPSASEFVVEAQHSRIKFEEVQARNRDYASVGRRVVWLVDCTSPDVPPPVEQGSSPGEPRPNTPIYLLQLSPSWIGNAFAGTDCVFLDYGEARGGIIRVSTAAVRCSTIRAYGPFLSRDAFRSLFAPDSSLLGESPPVPFPCRLTVSQDPAGSGKTYRLVQSILTDPDQRAYTRFLVVTKSHAAKDVAHREFVAQAERAGVLLSSESKARKHTVRARRGSSPNEHEIVVVFSTADALLFNCGPKGRVRGAADQFKAIAEAIAGGCVEKVCPRTGAIFFAGESVRVWPRTQLIIDEATMLSESYAAAFKTLMRLFNADAHWVGDVEQSTFYVDNALVAAYRRAQAYCEANGTPFPPSPSDVLHIPAEFSTGASADVVGGVDILLRCGDEVRRFPQKLVDFRNAVVLHQGASAAATPPASAALLRTHRARAAPDMNHQFEGDYVVRVLPTEREELCPPVKEAKAILQEVEKDANDHLLLPQEVLVVTPFVSTNQTFSILHQLLHDFWAKKLEDKAYCARVAQAQPREYAALINHLDKCAGLPWLAVAHRSEEGKPIDTSESVFATRMVSIHAAQGDGRRAVYVFGLSESALGHFSGFRRDQLYVSLLNVAVTRTKQLLRVFLQPVPDDVFRRFRPFISQGELKSVRRFLPPFPKTRPAQLRLPTELVRELLGHIENEIVDTAAEARLEAPLVDYQHHIVQHTVLRACIALRMLALNSKIDANVKQTVIRFEKVAKALVHSVLPKKFRELMRKQKDPSVIPVCLFQSGRHKFEQTKDAIVRTLNSTKRKVEARLNHRVCEPLTPAEAVALVYMYEWFTPCRTQNCFTVPSDTLYDAVYALEVGAQQTSLAAHYELAEGVNRTCNALFDTLAKGSSSLFLASRSLCLGTPDKQPLPDFALLDVLPFLWISGNEAVLVRPIPVLDGANAVLVCTEALWWTLMCMRPSKYQTNHEERRSSNESESDSDECPRGRQSSPNEKRNWKGTDEHLEGVRLVKTAVATLDRPGAPFFLDLQPIIEKHKDRLFGVLVSHFERVALAYFDNFHEYVTGFSTPRDAFWCLEGNEKVPGFVLQALKNAETGNDLRLAYEAAVVEAAEKLRTALAGEDHA